MSDKYIVLILLWSCIGISFLNSQILSTERLIQCLRNQDEQIVIETLHKLNHEKNRALLPVILSLANHPAPQVRRKVASVLGDWQEPTAQSLLVANLSDSDKLVRATSVWALGMLQQTSVLPHLSKALLDPAWEVRCAAVNAFGYFPHEQHICRQLQKSLKDNEWQVRYVAVRQLGRFKCHESLGQLHQLLHQGTDHVTVLAAICKTLEEIGAEESLPWLVESLASDKAALARESSTALTKIGPRCYDHLIKIFQDSSQAEPLRYEIGLILGRIRAHQALPILYRIARDEAENERVRHVSLILLADFAGKDAVSLFMEQASSNRYWVQKGAITALGQIRARESFPLLIVLLASENQNVHEQALQAMASYNADVVTDFVLRELRDPSNDRVCLGAIRLAGTLQIVAAIPFLRNIQDRPQWQKPALWALKNMATQSEK